MFAAGEIATRNLLISKKFCQTVVKSVFRDPGGVTYFQANSSPNGLYYDRRLI